MLSTVTPAGVKGVLVCATSYNNAIYCNSRVGTGTWAGWHVIAPPPGVTLGASGPSLAAFTDSSLGGRWQLLAARQTGGDCANCVWVQSMDPHGTFKWTLVPNSGVANGFNGDLNLVQSYHDVFLVASGGGNPSYSVSYTQAYEDGTFLHSGSWTPWKPVPGVFNAPITATGSLEGVLLAGVGTDGVAYTLDLRGETTWRPFMAGSFGDSPAAYWPTPRWDVPADIMMVGMGSDHVEYEGELTAGRTVLNGWFATSGGTFLTSPVMSAAVAQTHVDMAALANTQLVVVSSWDLASPSCADGTVEQRFGNHMVGCSGAVTWPQRISLCGSGSRVCVPTNGRCILARFPPTTIGRTRTCVTLEPLAPALCPARTVTSAPPTNRCAFARPPEVIRRAIAAIGRVAAFSKLPMITSAAVTATPRRARSAARSSTT